MMNSWTMAMMLTFLTFWIIGSHLDTNGDYIGATVDNGCSTHPHKVIEQKQIKDTYNMNSLGGEG